MKKIRMPIYMFFFLVQCIKSSFGKVGQVQVYQNVFEKS